MNQNTPIILHLFLVSILCVEAQAPIQNGSSSGTFQPSLGLALGVLFLAFSAAFVIIIYVKLRRRGDSVHGDRDSVHGDRGNERRQLGSSSRFSGIDKTVVESLPFFRFSVLQGFREGLECAVCLSEFKDIEVLRLLPKCRHAFHIHCIDHWLENHSSCPLCRQKVSSEDLALMNFSSSLRYLGSKQAEQRADSNIDFFVRREEDLPGSCRFCIGSSFRRTRVRKIEEEVLINGVEDDEDEEKNVLHKHNHKIIVSDFLFMNRWSNVSSSDLMFLNSEMLGDMSSSRFSCLDPNGTAESTENEEHELKTKVSDQIQRNSVSDLPNTQGRRSVSEITALSRFQEIRTMKNMLMTESSMVAGDVREERARRLWFPIARRTVRWFANREGIKDNTRQVSEV